MVPILLSNTSLLHFNFQLGSNFLPGLKQNSKPVP
jgi:hypothetical protein